MLRQEIKAFVRNYLNLDPSGSNGVGSLLMDTLINSACDQLARETRCLYYSYAFDIVSGQQEYATPPLIKTTFGSVTDAAGQAHVLRLAAPSDLDRSGVLWRVSPEQGTPRAWLMEGETKAKFYPVPNYSSLVSAGGGATLEGYGVPGTGVYGVSWDGPTDSCPLPVVAHMGVVWRTIELVAGTNPKLWGAQGAFAREEYRKAEGSLEAEVGRKTEDQRRREGVMVSALFAS